MLNQVQCFKPLFDQSGHRHLAYKVINYFDIQTLKELINIYPSQQQLDVERSTQQKSQQRHFNTSPILDAIKTQFFMKEYLNKADRSLYFSFYEEPQFINIQKEQIQRIALQIYQQKTETNHLSNFPQRIENVFSKIQKQTQLNQFQLQQLKRMFTDPSIPLPKMKRQNEGIYCGSCFQLFLVGLRFSHGQIEETIFEELKQKIGDQQDIYLKKFLQIQKQKHIEPLPYQNIHFVRYTPYQITYQNYSSLIIKNHTLHNVIIYIFTLTELFIDATFQYIQNINDPLFRFVEVMGRYSAFRSFVMEIQENLNFLFEIYDNLYEDTIRDCISNKPQFSFWRPAMSKWYLKMNSFHEQANQIYFMLLTRMRANNLETVFQKHPLLKQQQISIKNNLSVRDFQCQLKQKSFYQFQGQSLVEEFFQQNTQLYEVLTTEYVEYIVDLAVNQKTVHWCGHSQNKLQTPYNSLDKDFKLYNNEYCQFLDKCVEGSDKLVRSKILNLLFQEQMAFLDQKNVKPLTLKPVVDQLNLFYVFEGAVIQKQELITYPIQLDFVFRDDNLRHFNEKAKICESINEEDKCFFSIPPLLSPQQILIKSINTNDSENLSQEQCFQYISDEQTETQFHAKNDKTNNFQIQLTQSKCFIDSQSQKMSPQHATCNENDVLIQTERQSKLQQCSLLLKINILDREVQFDSQNKKNQEENLVQLTNSQRNSNCASQLTNSTNTSFCINTPDLSLQNSCDDNQKKQMDRDNKIHQINSLKKQWSKK